MMQMLQFIHKVAQCIGQNPAAAQAAIGLLGGTKRYYSSLSPEKKEAFGRVILWGAKMLARHTLPDVLGIVAEQAIAAVGDVQAGTLAKAVLTRVPYVGVEKAMEEVERG